MRLMSIYFVVGNEMYEILNFVHLLVDSMSLSKLGKMSASRQHPQQHLTDYRRTAHTTDKLRADVRRMIEG